MVDLRQEETTMEPVVLLDTWDDGVCENLGWVEATVSEDKARDALAEFCYGPDGDELGHRPDCGPATKVRLAPADRHAEKWERVPAGDVRDDAMEFWEVPVV